MSWALLAALRAMDLADISQDASERDFEMDPTDSERQLIETIRELPEGNEFHLTIKRDNGAWHLTISVSPRFPYAVHGAGATFDAAWDGAAPIGL
jgi:hypothetical protein